MGALCPRTICPRTVFSFRALPVASAETQRGDDSFHGEKRVSIKTNKKRKAKMNSKVNGVTKGKINIGDAIKGACEILKKNFVLLCITTIITSVISSFTGTLLLGPMMMGMFVVCDNLVLSKTPKAEIGDLFKGFSFIVPGIILDILGDCGILICGVGTVITLPIATWAMMRVVDTGMSVGDALKDSITFILKEKNYSFILVFLLAGVLASLGAILCFVGIIVTLPLLFLIPACAYRQVYPAGNK